MIETILKYNFLQNAIMAAVLASIACGVIGVYIMEKKLVMMSGGIAHTAHGHAPAGPCLPAGLTGTALPAGPATARQPSVQGCHQ